MDHDIEIRSKKNVRDNGEVFTPLPIVEKMNSLIPNSAWEDKDFCFLEPSCGNGQILVNIFEKRISFGVSIENALNTLIGMDISRQNILECNLRLYNKVCHQMLVEDVIPKSEEWFIKAMRFVAICTNNIFLVDDSIDFIKSGELRNKLFFFHDPTENGQVLSNEIRLKRLRRIQCEFIKYKNGRGVDFLSPFFENTRAA